MKCSVPSKNNGELSDHKHESQIWHRSPRGVAKRATNSIKLARFSSLLHQFYDVLLLLLYLNYGGLSDEKIITTDITLVVFMCPFSTNISLLIFHAVDIAGLGTSKTRVKYRQVRSSSEACTYIKFDKSLELISTDAKYTTTGPCVHRVVFTRFAVQFARCIINRLYHK